ncbi:hypothetical protein PVAP13_8KG124500 [Panicum virgatum]|uniref:Uncharacterized protein n=1 Tax=Panicum virgatum TaxID=38727 RepID=A0A8T0PNJ3_PANVG|nr:hypothetical protein PVAP13_8KG124500 [Panicum virgatum]
MFQGTQFTSMTPATSCRDFRITTVHQSGAFFVSPYAATRRISRSLFLSTTTTTTTSNTGVDNNEASFDNFTRLFATPAQDDDPNLHTPLAQLRRPARDVRPPDRHSYPTDHVPAQRKRGRHGRGG